MVYYRESMKRHKYIAILILFLLFISPIFASAAGFSSFFPIGGKVLKTEPSAEIVCAALYGPIFITSINFSSTPGPFFIRYGRMTPRAGGWILGKYNIIPDVGTCYNPETGVPIPAFELRPYGTSR